MLKKLFRRKKIIKKPNWFKCVIPFGIVFYLVAMIIFSTTNYYYLEAMYVGSEYENLSTYIREISLYGCDGFSEEEYTMIRNRMAVVQGIVNFPTVISLDGEEICNSSYAINACVSNDEIVTNNNDKFFSYHWDPKTDANVQKLLDYKNDMGMTHSYSFNVQDYYVDFDTHTLYVGKVKVYKTTATPFVIIGDPFDIGFMSEKECDEVDLTPQDKSLVEGLVHVDNTNFDDEYSLTMFSVTGSAEGENMETIDDEEYQIGDSKYVLSAHSNTASMDKIRNIYLNYYEGILVITALVLALVLGTIKYFKNKSTYEIFEYRRQTTNAMAHDLKTPLAIASLSVANLKENLKVNDDRVEYHANEIDDSISYMDQLICNILDFSNSESSDCKLNKQSVDVKSELEAYKKDINNVLGNRKLTLEINGEAKRTADKKIWNQAIFNLIDNATKYASEGTTIIVTLGEKEISISNSVDKEVLNMDKILEPFVKGNDSRGENSGSGLGLAIADNNFRKLGYKLKVTCVGTTFTAQIK